MLLKYARAVGILPLLYISYLTILVQPSHKSQVSKRQGGVTARINIDKAPSNRKKVTFFVNVAS